MVDSFTPNDIYEMFPELKESDDERIRKELIGFLRNIPNSNYTCEEMALWLEKQGVQPRYNIGDIICDKSCTTLNKEAQPNMEIVDIKNGMYICDKGSFPVSQQDEYELVSKKIDPKLNNESVSNELREASFAHARKEIKNTTFPDNEEFELVYTFEEGAKWDAAQKSAWSEEDEEELKIALNTLEEAGQYSSAKWLKNVCLVPQTIQKPTEWSEEDEGILDEIIDFLENGTVKLQHDLSLYASWLKSLKDRYTWRASWEQLDALEYHLKHTNENSRLYKETKNLYDQLKKL
jgi:hypothetical protein